MVIAKCRYLYYSGDCQRPLPFLRLLQTTLTDLLCCLQKGAGYHLDLLLIAIQMFVCSVMGLPWFVAATVLSINHVRSLTRESESAAPGERPQFLGVR